MIKRANKTIYLLLIGMVVLVGFLWLSLHPVEIIAVHQDRYRSHILVKNFPFTTKGKIKWWLENKEMLKSRYGIPKLDLEGFFTINFWLFGDGYKASEYKDRFCFEDMKTEKNLLFSVSNDSRGKLHLRVINGGDYLLKENGKVVKDDDFIFTYSAG